MSAPDTPENERLKKFVDDQTEAVKLARGEAQEKSCGIRIDALNVALSIASYNRENGMVVTVGSVIADAREVEAFLRERK